MKKTVFIAASLFIHSACYAETFTVGSIVVIAGKRTNQTDSALAVMDNSGTSDNWNGYIEFSRNNSKKRYGSITVDFTIKVNDKFPSGNLDVNMQGDESPYSQVDFYIKNNNGNYELIGNNSGQGSWAWYKMSLPLPQDISSYKEDNAITIRMSSENARNPILVDQLIISAQDAPPVTPPSEPPGGTFTPGLSWYWQLDGTLNKGYNVDVYEIDMEYAIQNGSIAELKAKGIKVVCYFSAGTYENWRSDAYKFSKDLLGKKVSGWPGENWLDIRREEVRSIMAQRIDLAASSGCDAVDPDNVDAYQNNNGLGLREADQADYLIWLADYAHSKGIKISLKNTIDLIQKYNLHKEFDFAVNEECYTYNECDKLSPFIGENKAVFIAQYKGEKSQYCPLSAQDNYFLAFFNIDLNGEKYDPCSY